MIKFSGKIVQFGFGAVGKSFYEKVREEIQFKNNDYFVITANKDEYIPYINLGGITTNFYVYKVTKENYQEIFSQFLTDGDILIDFADTVGTKDICKWCIDNNIMYLNTGEADWPDNWYSIFEENIKKNKLKKECHPKYPIVLQHGNNPGLVSHFVKLGLEYIVNKQFKHNKYYKQLIKDNKFNLLAYELNVKMVHVNDIDLQNIKENFKENKLVSTWCVDSFFFELLSEATQNIGTYETNINKDECNLLDYDKGFVEYKKLAVDMPCKTYYSNGKFIGYLVPHEETITIANSLEVKNNDKVIYRPSVMFIYSPCFLANQYLINSKTNLENENIVRNHIYPNEWEIVYEDKIKDGTEYVGVLIIGDNFNPVWIGNRIELSYLYRKKNSYFQTPTITPVAMSALSALCWMIKNKEKGGIYFPDDIKDYKYIVKKAEKYISKTIYKTIDKNILEKSLNIDITNLQSNDFYAKEKE